MIIFVMMIVNDANIVMLKLINRCVKAPLSYISDLRAISFK